MLTNAHLAELLARRAEKADGYRQRAYGRAAGAALAWPYEARDLLADGGDLATLPWVGRGIASVMEEWLEESPEVPEAPPERQGFMTYAHALAAVRAAGFTAAAADLQMHTVYSDGAATVAEMARVARELGRTYIAVTDHSSGQRVPRGMLPEDIDRQRADVQAVNGLFEDEGSGFIVLHGVEVNLDPAGRPLVDGGYIEGFELVLGAFHSKLRSTGDETPRFLGALDSGVHVLAHPTARRFNMRPGLNADWDVVFSDAARRGVALEIDCHPHRQDLRVELVAAAAEEDATFTLGTDAHDPDELRFIELGVAIILEAGVALDRVLNFMPAADALERLGGGFSARPRFGGGPLG